MDTIARLRNEIEATEKELERLKAELKGAEAQAAKETSYAQNGHHADDIPWKWPLTAGEYERYSRQLIIPHVGVPGIRFHINYTSSGFHHSDAVEQQANYASGMLRSSSSARAVSGAPRQPTWPVRASVLLALLMGMLSKCRTSTARLPTLRREWAC